MRRSFSAAVALAAGLMATQASAFERQHHVGGALAASWLKVTAKDTLSSGLGGELHYTYGLSDAFNLMVEAGYAQVALEESSGKGITNNRPTAMAHAGAGVAYVLDVLRWVPYFGVLAEGYGYVGGNLASPRAAGGLAVAAGLDYAISRSLAVGVAFREHFALTALGDYPTCTQALLRAEYVWGW